VTASAQDKVSPQRSDVFISYSRKDRDFVRRLEETLKSRGRETWVDWQGIRPAEEFLQAIFPAIEGTDTFVFVLSPDSVTSEICGKELAHAVSHNKRMIPIMARDTDAKAVPEPLAKLNWVFARDADSFEAAADFLISALDTDLGWVRAHTRLLTRAIEWDGKAKSDSFVLRGEDLRAAEQWLSEAGTDKERQPTPLQTTYIIASRKAAARRQKIMLGAVTFAMIVTIALAILAYLNAEKTKRTLANADFLRAAELLDQNRADEALAYLARSVRTRPRDSVAADRIFTLLTQRGWMLPASTATTLPGRITSIRFTDGGGCLAASVVGDAAQVFDLRSGKPATEPLRHDGRLVQMAELSPDGKLMATACGETNPDRRCEIWPRFRYYGGEVTGTRGHGRVWEVGTGKPLTPPLEHAKAVIDIRFDAKGSRVVTVSDDQTVRVWDALTGRAVTPPLQHEGPVLGARFSPEGTRLVVATDPLSIWDLASSKRVPIPKLEHAIAAEYSPDGEQIAVVVAGLDSDGHQLEHVQLVAAATGQSAPEPPDSPPLITSISFDPPRKRVLTAYAGATRIKDDTGGVDEFDTESSKITKRHPMNGAPVYSVAVLRGQEDFLTASGDRTVRLQRWDNENQEMHPANPLKFPTPPLHIECAPSGAQFAVVFGTGGNSVQLWNAPSAAQESEIVSVSKKVRSVSVPEAQEAGMVVDTSRDRTRVLKVERENSIIVCDAKSGARISGPFRPEGGYEEAIISAAKFSPKGDLIAVGEGGHYRLRKGFARVWNANTGRPVTGPLIHTFAVRELGFSDDEERLITLQSKDVMLFSTRIWDIRSGIALTDRMPPEGVRRKLPEEGEVAEIDRSRGQLTNYSPPNAPEIAEVRDVAFPAGTVAPDWLPQLAELVGGMRLNAETGVIEPVPEQWSKLEALRAELAASKRQDPFTALGKWFLADPRKRTLSPYNKLTARDYFERCLTEKSEPFVIEANRLAGDDPKLLERIKSIREPR
jgi:WD40 repeat protein